MARAPGAATSSSCGVSTAWKARPTTYRGIQMRSRLEARYAAELDAKGKSWTYEPRAFANQRGQYLPDFEVIWGDRLMFIEVKPTVELAQLVLERMEIILESLPGASLVCMVPDVGMFMRWPDGQWRWATRPQ